MSKNKMKEMLNKEAKELEEQIAENAEKILGIKND